MELKVRRPIMLMLAFGLIGVVALVVVRAGQGSGGYAVDSEVFNGVAKRSEALCPGDTYTESRDVAMCINKALASEKAIEVYGIDLDSHAGHVAGTKDTSQP